MTRTQRESIDAVIARLRRQSDATDSLRSHRLAQIDLLEQLLDRAIVTHPSPENPSCL